jgi:hypothetical protein
MNNKDAKHRLIGLILLLKEFDLYIVDRKGEYNPVADHLSRMKNIPLDPLLLMIALLMNTCKY